MQPIFFWGQTKSIKGSSPYPDRVHVNPVKRETLGILKEVHFGLDRLHATGKKELLDHRLAPSSRPIIHGKVDNNNTCNKQYVASTSSAEIIVLGIIKDYLEILIHVLCRLLL